jgi:hypothetical protein
MATTTTNYGFDIPQSTDLVKDGATAIATLGQDIDTAMNTALGTKKAGMVLLNTTSFSGVSSVSLAADTFTTAYKNYKVIFTGTATSLDSNALQIRGRVSGTDNTTSNWFNFIYERSNSAGSSAYGASGSFGYAGAIANSGWSAVIDILDPKASASTQVLSTSVAKGTNSSIAYWFASNFNASTSFDSATFYGFSGTISGQYSVYGYNA